MAKSGAERMRELRQRKKLAGKKPIRVEVPGNYKERFDLLCRQLRATAAETVCYFIDLATDEGGEEG